MKKILDFQGGGTFILSENELGYQEILEDFPNAQIIKIVTYNISKSVTDDKLFEELSKLKEDTEIEFITNIPSRFEWYSTGEKGEYLRRTARININAYINKLNPNNFNKIIPFFNFNNHAKIIATENIAYIGSANFSNESSKNYETGVIIRDKLFIHKLFEEVFKDLKANSIPYFEDNYFRLRLFIASIVSRLNNHYEYYTSTLFYERDNAYVFIDDETSFSYDDQLELLHDVYELEEISGLLEELEVNNEILFEQLEGIQELLSFIDIRRMIEIIDIDTGFYQYINFDLEKTTQDCLEEYSAVAFDEQLDFYADKAADDARDILCDLCTEAGMEIHEFRELLQSTIQYLENILMHLIELSEHVVNKNIDNT